MKNPTEEDFKKQLEKLREKDPNWKLTEEFGKYLFRKKEDLSPQELLRYNYLKSELDRRKNV